MHKLFTTLFTLLAAASTIAQVSPPFFSENFSNGFGGNNGIGPITYADNGNNTIWMIATANSPAGDFSNMMDGMNSTTAANGWVIFDADLYNSPFSAGISPVNGWLELPAIDCSDKNSVMLEFQQYFRLCCDPVSPLTIDVSNDDGNSWTSFPAHPNLNLPVNDVSPNPVSEIIDISCVAANSSSVQIRFSFNAENNPNYTHYFWGIDDISLYSNLAETSLSIVDMYVGDILNNFTYDIIPFEQRTFGIDGGLFLPVILQNNGINNLINTTLNVQVINELDIVIHDSNHIVNVFAPENNPDCPSQQNTFYVPTGWEPQDTGNYTVRLTAETLQPENDLSDNVIEKPIRITLLEHGHEYSENFDMEIFPPTNGFIADYDIGGYGSYFKMRNQGSQMSGVRLLFGETTVEDSPFYLNIYTNNPNTGTLVYENLLTVQPEWLDGEYHFIQLEGGPIDLLQGIRYFIGIVNPDFTNTPVTLAAINEIDHDHSTGYYRTDNTGQYLWIFDQNFTPALRLVLADINVEGCATEGACNYSPLAIFGNGTCYYPGDSCDDSNIFTINDQVNEECACVGVTESLECPDFNISLIAQAQTCPEIINGSVSAIVEGNSGPFTYVWNVAEVNDSMLTNIPAGQYFLMVTDSNQCTEFISTFVAQIPDMIASGGFSPLSCQGSIDASAFVEISGGTPPYTFVWNTSPEVSDSLLTGIGAGTYVCNFYDENECQGMVEITILDEANFNPFISGPTNPSFLNTTYYTVNDPGVESITWTIQGGEILTGQGTGAIAVEWENIEEGWIYMNAVNDSDCAVSDTLYIDIISHISERHINSIHIYPNPATDRLMISSNKQENISVYSSSGALFAKVQLRSGVNTINLEKFPPGLYTIQQETDLKVSRFMKFE